VAKWLQFYYGKMMKLLPMMIAFDRVQSGSYIYPTLHRLRKPVYASRLKTGVPNGGNEKVTR
jgi:hypothetical protein